MFFGPLIRISLIVGSFSSISSGPRPKVSSSTSLTSRSRSARFRSVSSVSHRCSTTRRISRRSTSPSSSPTRDRSSLSTSLPWMRCLSCSKLFSLESLGRAGAVIFAIRCLPSIAGALCPQDAVLLRRAQDAIPRRPAPRGTPRLNNHSLRAGQDVPADGNAGCEGYTGWSAGLATVNVSRNTTRQATP